MKATFEFLKRHFEVFVCGLGWTPEKKGCAAGCHTAVLQIRPRSSLERAWSRILSTSEFLNEKAPDCQHFL